MYVKLSQNNVKQSDNNISTLATPTDQRTVIFLYGVLKDFTFINLLVQRSLMFMMTLH